MTTEIVESVVLLEHGQMDSFHKRMALLNKKATKFGLPLIEVVSTRDASYKRVRKMIGRGDDFLSELVPVSSTDGPDVEIVLIHKVAIRYPLIRLGDWFVLGKLELAEDGQNLMFSVTQNSADQVALSDAAKHPIGCEHCNTKRKRNEGYLLRSVAESEYKKVGSTCLSDFTGVDPAAVLFLAQMSQFIRVFEEEFESFGSSSKKNAIGTRDYLSRVIFCAAQSGFVSAAKSREQGISATYDDAIGLPFELQKDSALMERFTAQIAKCRAEADEVISWVKDRPDENSFDSNVRVLLSNDAISIDRKHLAFAAASVAMFHAHQRKAQQELVPSNHIGAVGDKFSTELAVDRIIPIENTFTGRMDSLVLMKNRDGSHVRWRTSACPDSLKEVGALGRFLEASFKVKSHAEYKGKKQTEVTHLKVIRWIDTEKPPSPKPGFVICSVTASPGSPQIYDQLPLEEAFLRMAEMGVTRHSEDGAGFVSGDGTLFVLHSIDGSEFRLDQADDVMSKILGATPALNNMRERFRS